MIVVIIIAALAAMVVPRLAQVGGRTLGTVDTYT